MRFDWKHCVAVYGLLSFLLIVSLNPLSSAGAVRDDLRDIRKADIFADRLMYDSALNIYRGIANKYRADMPKDEKFVCLRAVYGCVDANLYRSNFSECMNYILLAEDIRASEGITDDALQVYYSALYIAMAVQTGKYSLLDYAVPHARRAYRYGLKIGDNKLVGRGFSNLLSALLFHNDMSLVRKDVKYLKAHGDQGNWKIRETLYLVKAREKQYGGDLRGSLKYYDSMYNVIPAGRNYDRNRAIVIKDRAIPKIWLGLWQEAVRDYDEVIRFALKYNMHDLRFSSMKGKGIAYREAGDTTLALAWDRKANALKDSLKTYFITDDLVKLEGLREQQSLRAEIVKGQVRHTVMTWALVVVAIIAIGTAVFVVVLRRKNRALGERARLLREKMREQYERRDFAAKSREDVPARYESSNVSEQEKDRIETEIRRVLDSEAVFDRNFSLKDLIEATGSNQKNVSQVIGERFGSNFSTLINRVRIVEACRRLDSKEYANWSVEGIAESVGYGLRSTFSTNFKKVTGMGIREYRRMSEQEHRSQAKEQGGT